MIIAKNDEEKRSKIWRVVTGITTVIIIVVAGFFITRMFTANPLEGTWVNEDHNLLVTIKGNNAMTVTVSELLEDTNIKLNMNYTLDKEAKTITIKMDESELKQTAEAQASISESSLQAALSVLTNTFDYSVEQNELILTEREYGEQMVFTKR